MTNRLSASRPSAVMHVDGLTFRHWTLGKSTATLLAWDWSSIFAGMRKGPVAWKEPPRVTAAANSRLKKARIHGSARRLEYSPSASIGQSPCAVAFARRCKFLPGFGSRPRALAGFLRPPACRGTRPGESPRHSIPESAMNFAGENPPAFPGRAPQSSGFPSIVPWEGPWKRSSAIGGCQPGENRSPPIGRRQNGVPGSRCELAGHSSLILRQLDVLQFPNGSRHTAIGWRRNQTVHRQMRRHRSAAEPEPASSWRYPRYPRGR